MRFYRRTCRRCHAEPAPGPQPGPLPSVAPLSFPLDLATLILMADSLRPLIEAARGGDRQALNTLAGCVDRFVRVFSGSLSSAVRRAQGSTIDFVLEGVADALSNLGEYTYKSDDEFYAWMARRVKNRIIDAARTEGRKKRAGSPAVLGDLAGAVESPSPTASKLVSAEEIRSEAGRILVELQLKHPQEMEAVVLKVYEGQSWPELKDAMGLSSEKRARTLFAKGLDLLRPRLEERLGTAVLEEFLGM